MNLLHRILSEYKKRNTETHFKKIELTLRSPNRDIYNICMYHQNISPLKQNIFHSNNCSCFFFYFEENSIRHFIHM